MKANFQIFFRMISDRIKTEFNFQTFAKDKKLVNINQIYQSFDTNIIPNIS